MPRHRGCRVHREESGRQGTPAWTVPLRMPVEERVHPNGREVSTCVVIGSQTEGNEAGKVLNLAAGTEISMLQTNTRCKQRARMHARKCALVLPAHLAFVGIAVCASPWTGLQRSKRRHLLCCERKVKDADVLCNVRRV
jgi:hypothetical protein